VIAVALLLTVSVGSTWLAAWGFLHLSSVYDRVHSVTFAGIAAGVPVVVAAFVSGGGAAGAFEVLLIFTLNSFCGAVLGHAIGRAVAFRETAGRQ